MTTTRREFMRGATILTAGLGVIGRTGTASAPAGSGAQLDMLILGGTGFLGPAVVEEALRRGHSMTLFNRGKTNPHLFPDLEKLVGDREQGIEALDKAVAAGRRWDVVIDTSAYIPSHVAATAGLVAEFARQYVLLSTVGVYADHSVPADETSEVATVDDEWVAGITTIRDSLEN
jgi:2'-hydroxyisoflavone reductase